MASRKGTQRRGVKLCKHVQPGRKGKGGRTQLWAFGVVDLGNLFDRGDEWVRVQIRSGRLDPTDLDSMFALLIRLRGLAPGGRKAPRKLPSLLEAGKTPTIGSFPLLPMPPNHDENNPVCACRRCFS